MSSPNPENKPFRSSHTQIERSLGSEEYLRGETPLTFDHEFNNGTRLVASQNKDYTGSIRFLRGDDVLISLDELLPEGYVIATPQYLEAHPDQREPVDKLPEGRYTASWLADRERKLIYAGNFHELQNILVALHEVGHIVDDRQIEIDSIRKAFRERTAGANNPEEAVKYATMHATAIAARERRAWTYAITELRRISNTVGFSMEEIFSSSGALRDYIHTSLENYKTSLRGQASQREQAAPDVFAEAFDKKFDESLELLFHGKGAPLQK